MDSGNCLLYTNADGFLERKTEASPLEWEKRVLEEHRALMARF
jgi:hypothetical protein